MLGFFLIPLSVICQTRLDSLSIYIKVETKPSDTLELRYTNNCLYPDIRVPTRTLYLNQKLSYVIFKLDSKIPFSYFSIIRTSKNNFDDPLLSNYLINPGDSIIINLLDKDVKFRGKGADKNNAIADIQIATIDRNKKYNDSIQIAPNIRPKESYAKFDSTAISYAYFELHRRITEMQNVSVSKLKALDKYRDIIPDFDFQLIKANIIAEKEFTILKIYNRTISIMPDDISENYKAFIREQIKEIYDTYYPNKFAAFDSKTLAFSQPFLEYTILQAAQTKLGKVGRYEVITTKYNGVLRDRLIAVLFSQFYNSDNSLSNNLPDALKIVTTDYVKYILADLVGNLSKGVNAFNFELQDTTGKLVKLTDFEGKIVVLDMWFTGCSSCKIMAERLKRINQKINKDNSFVFVSISIDADRKKWLRSVKTQQYTNDRSIDLYTNGLGDKYAMIKHYKIISYPTLIIIDTSGKIFSGNPIKPVDTETEHKFTDLLMKARR